MSDRTRVKICGIGRPEDAVAAADAGADAIGLVFHPSAPRNITPPRARQILSALPPFVSAVGLFVDADTRLILDTADDLRLRHVQLHGHESPQQVAELRDLPGLAVLKAIRISAATLEAELLTWRRAIAELKLDNLRGLVLETAGPAPGGTGLENDWQAIRRAQDAGAFADLPPLIAAGGLRPDNVAAVVRLLRPWAVDVSSGVESLLGRKSPEKIRAFVQAATTA